MIFILFFINVCATCTWRDAQGKRARLRAKFSSHPPASAPRAAIAMTPTAVQNAANLLSSPRVEARPGLLLCCFVDLLSGVHPAASPEMQAQQWLGPAPTAAVGSVRTS